MNAVEGIGWKGSRVARQPATRPRAALSPEQIILSVAVVGPLLGAVTHPLLGAGAGIAVATFVTLRHLAADVHALRVWASE
ncbi:MAG: hypothetical protein ACRENE_32520 [Polyangiaceae bacterium]